MAASLFTLDEFLAVIDKPTDRPVRQAADSRVFFGPLHHAAAGIHMADVRARRGTGQGSRARVAKKIEHVDRAARLPDFLHGELPVDGLFRKNARVFEAHGLQPEGQALPGDVPHRRDLPQYFPMASA